MARLNEPLVPTDNIDTLRRKFLRQNRDIARINSTQSLRIRSLENECARMLSENLDLRGQILRLETELHDSRAQRIADHALAIKEKMEAQLVEWGSMLAGLGHEPIPRNRSPRATKKVKRSSIGRGSLHWRRRDSIDMEALALHEGRLPPIWETKSYPRETLNREEILAICSEATEATDSPDLGPPPVSRFVDEDPVKIDLPARASTDDSEPSTLAESATDPIARPRTTTSTANRFEETQAKEASNSKSEQPARKEPKAQTEKEVEPRTTKPAPTAEPEAPAQTVKASLKRKSRDEEEIADARVTKPLVPIPPAPATTQPEKSAVFKDRPTNRPIKELPTLKKEARGKLKNNTITSGAQRKPLGAKTTNENFSSPKKAATTKPNGIDEVTRAKSDAKQRDERPKSRAEPKKEKAKETKEAAVVLEIPHPSSEPVPATTMTIDIEPTTAAAAAAAAATPQEPPEPKSNLPAAPPESPAPALREEIHDTPPPLDISARGETTRGSRRTRPTVSYAEPNLRDKMRRPTKQLFDAVAGEGKNQMRRASSSQPAAKSELPTPASAASSSSSAHYYVASGGEARSSSSSATTRRTIMLPDVPASPLAQKASSRVPQQQQQQQSFTAADGGGLPTSVVTDRKKRNSSVLTEPEGTGKVTATTAMAPPSARSTNRRLEEIAAREAEVAKMFDGPEDESSSVSVAGSSPRTGRGRGTAATSSSSSSSSSSLSSTTRNGRIRRLSSMAREDLDIPTAEEEKRAAARSGGGASSSSRKRASMMALGSSKSRIGMGVGVSVNDDPEAAGGHDSSSLDGDSNLTVSSADSSFSSAAAAVDSTSARERASTRRRSMML